MALSILRYGSPNILCTRLRYSNAVLAAVRSSATSSSTDVQTPAEAQAQFWEKNKRLNRPLSPWMFGTVYKIQLTSLLSITHRGTGMGMGILLYAWGVQSCFSGSSNWAQTLDWMSATFPSFGLYALKVLVATSFGYHFFNGIRHLLWDMGYGFTLKEVYASGYFVVGLTLIIGIIAAMNA